MKTSNTDAQNTQKKSTVQVTKIRCFIRETKYLLEPQVVKLHKSIIGEDLCDHLVSLPSLSKENIQLYISAKSTGSSTKLKTVYVTKVEMEEANKLENKTVQELEILIFSIIDDFDSSSEKLYEDIYKKSF